MEKKAYADGVNFQITLQDCPEAIRKSGVRDTDLCTLIADLVDNARISMRAVRAKNILLCLGRTEDGLSLDVFDSGTPFAPEVIARMGLERVTTHADGSGIGIMTTFTILRRYGASFRLDESLGSALYTKKLSIRFDGRCRTQIKTRRQELLALAEKRPDLDWI